MIDVLRRVETMCGFTELRRFYRGSDTVYEVVVKVGASVAEVEQFIRLTDAIKLMAATITVITERQDGNDKD